MNAEHQVKKDEDTNFSVY